VTLSHSLGLTVHRTGRAVTIVATRLRIVIVETRAALDHFAWRAPGGTDAGQVAG